MNYKKLFIIVFLVSYLPILPSEQRSPVSTMVKTLRCMRGKVIDIIMSPKAVRIFPFMALPVPVMAIGASFLYSLHNLQSTHCDQKLEKMCPLIDEELLASGIQPHEVKLSYDVNAGYARAFALGNVKTLMIGTLGYEEFEEAPSQAIREEKDKKKKELRAVIRHEIGHIKNKDTEGKIMVVSSFAGLHYFISTKLLKQINKRISSKKLQAGLIASSAVLLSVGNRLFFNAYCRHKEALADENIPQEKEYLEGACSYFEKSYKLNKVLIAHGLMHETSQWAYLWNARHPTDEMRLKRFQERLALLEKNKSA